jgi:hypothetical protein
MTISVEWRVPNKVLSIKVSDRMMLQDMVDLVTPLESYVQTVKSFHQIYDLSEMSHLPSLADFKVGLRPDLMTTGYVFVVGTMNPMVKFMSTTVVQFTGIRMKTAPTVDDALVQLQKLDLTLTSLMKTTNTLPQ